MLLPWIPELIRFFESPSKSEDSIHPSLLGILKIIPTGLPVPNALGASSSWVQDPWPGKPNMGLGPPHSIGRIFAFAIVLLFIGHSLCYGNWLLWLCPSSVSPCGSFFISWFSIFSSRFWSSKPMVVDFLVVTFSCAY